MRVVVFGLWAAQAGAVHPISTWDDMQLFRGDHVEYVPIKNESLWTYSWYNYVEYVAVLMLMH